NLDGFFARYVFGNENVHLALHEVIHHQFLPSELLIEMQHIDYVAVGKLKADSGWRVRWSGRGICRGLWIDCLNRGHRGAVRFALSGSRRRADKHECGDTKKPVHSLILMDGRA